MRSRLDSLLERRLGRWPGLVKWVKYSSASASGAITSQIVLLTCILALEMGARPANVLAVSFGAVPNYLINRTWTFDKQGSHSLTREVLPFWGMALLGLIISTIAVGWVEDTYGTNALALSATNIGSFGVLWIARFFVLERVLFKPLAEYVEAHEDAEGRLHIHTQHPLTDTIEPSEAD